MNNPFSLVQLTGYYIYGVGSSVTLSIPLVGLPLKVKFKGILKNTNILFKFQILFYGKSLFLSLVLYPLVDRLVYVLYLSES